jgi:PAS domain S-box-containing protein
MATVLLVDDEADFLDIIRTLLERQGFTVETASSGEEAIAAMERKKPDAIVCDYKMPDTNGIEILKRVHARGYGIPFILMTGNGREEIVIEAIDNGANYYVQKGGSAEALVVELKHKINLAVKHAADEEELRLSKFSLDNASVAILWLSDQGIITRANHAAGNLLGCCVDELLGRSMLEIDIGMSPERWNDNVEVCQRLGRLRCETSFLKSNGDMLPVEVELNALERHGRLCLVGFVRDIQDRKLAEEYSGEKLVILEGLQEMAIEYIDADMMLRWTNLPRGPAEYSRDGAGYCFELLQRRSQPCPGCPALRAFKSGSTERGEVQDLEGRTFMVCSTPLRDPSGRILGVVNSSLDISDLKTHDDSLENALKAIEGSIDGIALLRADQTYWYMNKAHASIYGYDSPEELLGRTWHVLYEQRELDRFKSDIMPQLQAEGSWRGEAVGKRKDGSAFEQELSLTMLNDGGLTCVVRDISQRKAIERELKVKEAALQESEALFRNLVEIADEGILTIDAEQRLTYVNHRIEEMLGYDAGEIIGKNSRDFFDPALEKEFEERFERRRMGESERYDFELVAKDGSRIPVRVAAVPLRNASGAFIGSMSVVVDISEMIAKEETLQRMNRRLNILSSITRHDILNQISVIGGYLELEKKAASPEKHAERLQKMAAALNSISRQIAFTKDYEEMGVKAPIWQGVAPTVRAAAAGLDLERIDLVIDTGGLQIFADPLLVKVFYNLLENSIRHGAGVTKVEVRVQKAERGLEITYRDDGAGIPEELRDSLFSRGCGGRSGLGLFLSKEILAITRIDIREDGGAAGVCFHITVPEGGYRFT